MSYASEVLADSPAFYFKMDEPSGTVMTDSSGNGQTGQYVGAPTLGVSPLITVGTAVTFTGANKAFNNVGISLASTGAFTVEAWFKRPSAPTATEEIFCADNDGGLQRMFQLRLIAGVGGATPDGTADFLVINNGGTVIEAISRINYGDGSRHQAVGTYDGTVGPSLYIDGALVHRPGGTLTLSNVSMGPVIAARFNGSFGNFFNGTVDEVSAYTTRLSDARVLAHYNAGIGVSATDLLLPTMHVGMGR